MSATIQLRRGTAAAWTSANPTLHAGEPGYETDTGRVKIGDGATAWTSLSYAAPGQPLGLTGATAATRYVGGTASGAPASGTFAKGDFVIGQDGSVWICTAAGSPGTWTQVSGGGGGGGAELTYDQFTAAVSITATSEATANTVVTATAHTFDGSTTVMVQFFAGETLSPAAGTWIFFTLYDGSSSIGQIGGQETGHWVPVHLERRLTPSAASHTYSVRAWVQTGTGLIGAGTGGSTKDQPGFIRIVAV